LAHDEIFDKRIFASKTWDAVDAERGIARVNRATRTRAIGTSNLRAQFGSVHLYALVCVSRRHGGGSARF
jgi:hypothetical protein